VFVCLKKVGPSTEHSWPNISNFIVQSQIPQSLPQFLWGGKTSTRFIHLEGWRTYDWASVFGHHLEPWLGNSYNSLERITISRIAYRRGTNFALLLIPHVIVQLRNMMIFFKPSILFTALLSASSVDAKWVRVGKEASSKNDYYGDSVSMSANLLAVGAPYSSPDSTKQNAGAVQIFERKGDKLELVDEIHGNAFDGLGEAVAVSRGTNTGGDNEEMVIVGAPRATHSGLPNAGLARVYIHNSRLNKWMQKGQDILGQWQGEFFGESVAISDDGLMICVGTGIGDDLKRGRVVIYKLDTVTNKWDEMGFALEGHAEGAKFGTSISIVQKNTDDEDLQKYYVAIGAPDTTNAMGTVKVYHWDDDLEDWDQIGEDLEGESKMDHFGKSVSLAYNNSNDLYLAVGMPSAPGYGGDPMKEDTSSDGRVQVYRYNLNRGDDTDWIDYGDEIEQLDDNDGTGEVVELSSDGMMLAIGSPQHNDGNGLVRVFKFDPAYDDYLQQGEQIRGKEGEALGTSFSFSGGGLAIGSPYQNYVQIYRFDESHHKKSGGFGRLFFTVIIIGAVGILVLVAFKKLKNRGFKFSSFSAALPGAAAFRRRGRSAVETEDHDEWPFGFFSASDRERITEARRAEEGRANVDGVVLHGMPKSVSQSSESGSEDGSYDSNNDSTHEMKQFS